LLIILKVCSAKQTSGVNKKINYVYFAVQYFIKYNDGQWLLIRWIHSTVDMLSL